jgi:regulator of protease activity HflC (stomatin/prohibitin superfamily)
MINRILRVLAGFAVVAVLLFVLVVIFGLTKVEPNEIGVRVNNIPIIHDVQKINITTPGYYFTIPKLYILYKVPGTLMSIYMVEQGDIKFKSVGASEEKSAAETATAPGAAKDDLEKMRSELAAIDTVNILVHEIRSGKESVWVKTADGNDVWVPIIVNYQVMPEKAHLALQNIGLKRGDFQKDIEALVNSVVRGKVRAYLSSLKTTGFVCPPGKRASFPTEEECIREVEKEESILNEEAIKKALGLAQNSLNVTLENNYGLQITSLEPLDPVLHPDFDDALHRENNAYALSVKYGQDAEKALKLADTKKNEAKGQADAMIAAAEGRRQALLQEAAAQLIALQSGASADEVKYKDQAEGIAAITSQLDRAGGDKQVGLAVARALQGKRIIIVPSEGALNLLDVNEILQSYGAANLILNKNKPGAKTDASPGKPADNAGKNTESSLIPPITTGAVETPDRKDATGIKEDVVGPPLDEPGVTPIPEEPRPPASNP